MKNLPHTEMAARYHSCCRDLIAQRCQRDNLTRLLHLAGHQRLAGWTDKFQEDLVATRRRIQRLSARKSRLSQQLGKAAQQPAASTYQISHSESHTGDATTDDSALPSEKVSASFGKFHS